MADKASLIAKIMAMSNLGAAGDVRGLRGVIEATEGREPGHRQTTPGRLILRSAANQGALHGKLDVLRYLCGARGVPPLANNPDEYALSDRLGMHQQDSMWGWRPLELAAIFGAKEVTMFLLSLTGPEDELGRPWLDGDGLLHYAEYAGDLPLLEALVQRGVDFTLGNDSGLLQLEGAIRYCRLSVVRFLIAQYQKQLKGRNALRELLATQPEDIQAVWKGSQNKEIEKAAAAMEMATRIQAAEEAMAELFLELEAAAATGIMKKGGKAGTGKNNKTK